MIRDIRNLFEKDVEEKYYKPVGVGNFSSNSYIEHESNDDRSKTVSVEEYTNKIVPYLRDIINNLKKSDMWKIKLTTAIYFISSKDNDEECVMYSKSNNKEIKNNDKPDEVIKKICKSLLNRYENNLKTSMRSSDFIFDYVHLLHCKCHEINLNDGRLYKDSLD